MRRTIKSELKRLVNWSVYAFENNAVGRYVCAQIVSNRMNRTEKVSHRGLALLFAIPNALSKYRAETFSIKEPATLQWIDSMPNGSILWDIGANVGLYSCYAAKRRGCRVFAFEPSPFNLELLARNIFLNDLTDQITVVPLPLSDTLARGTLNMTNTEWGGALSTFGKAYGHDGEALHNVFEFSTVGISMVDAVALLNVPQPDYIKIDVDGIEHLILKGGKSVLLKTKGVLIEINDRFTAQAESANKYLSEAHFFLSEKAPTDAERYVCNQIWTKRE